MGLTKTPGGRTIHNKKSEGAMMKITLEMIAKKIDHSVLKPDHTDRDIAKGCEVALKYGVAAFCVKPSAVAQAFCLLQDSGVKVCTVIGFPFGYNTPTVKAYEAESAINDGADELDMVINSGKLIGGDYKYVLEDIQSVTRIAKMSGASVKVILETSLLTPSLIIKACRIAEEADADFVKTSTGFVGTGADIGSVRLMLDTVGDRLGVKASGGIRTLDQAIKFIEHGCARIGTGSTEAILNTYETNPGEGPEG
jgi:deoxyribose-phosphate aldolase